MMFGRILAVLAGGLVLIVLSFVAAFIYSSRSLQYDLAVTATIAIDGKQYTQTRPLRCVVHDYRWLVSGGHGATATAEPLYFIHGKRAVALEGIKPCHWLDAPPPSESVYQLKPSLSLNPNDENSGTDLPVYSASAIVIDDIDDGRRARVFGLLDVERGLVRSVRLISLSVAARRVPDVAPIASAIPWLVKTANLDAASVQALLRSKYRKTLGPDKLAAARLETASHNMFSVEARIGGKGSRVGDCFGGLVGQAAKWRVIKKAGCAGTTRLLHATIDQSATNVTVNLAAIDPAVEYVSNFDLLERGVGHFYTDDSKHVWSTRYVWPVRVCLEGTCAMVDGGTPKGPSWVSFGNAASGEIVTVTIGVAVVRGDINRLRQ